MPDQVERVMSVTALLLETRVPLTLHDIHRRLKGLYPENEAARRASFERDKDVMHLTGVPIRQTYLAGDQAGQTGYWIDRNEYELQDLGLADDERRALQAALTAVHIGADWTDDANMKIGGSLERAMLAWTATFETPDCLPLFYEAHTQGRVVEFTYNDRERRMQPWGLLGRGGFWYVIGWDVESREQRTYRVDRIDGAVRMGKEGGFPRPDGFDPSAAFDAGVQSIGDEGGASEATVLVDASRAPGVLRELGPEAVLEARPDGAVVVRVGCRNRLVFRAWLLGLASHAEVLGPDEVRTEIIAWLTSMAGRQ